MNHSLVETRRQAALLGFLVGETIGVPFDSVPRQDLPPAEHIGPLPPSGMLRRYPHAPAGAWADGGSQVLALIDSLGTCGSLDLDDLSERLMRWLARGEYCVESVVFEYGVQTARALAAFREGVPAAECGPKGERHNGNGALMRVLPIALWWHGDDASLVAQARRSCLPTHGHAISQLCAALYSLWIRLALNDHAQPWTAAVQTLQFLLTDADDQRWLNHILEAEQQAHPNNRYVVNTLWSVRDAYLSGDNWLERVRAAIRIGNDTDTVAALVGGVSAASEGTTHIPMDWLGATCDEPSVQSALNVVARFTESANMSL